MGTGEGAVCSKSVRPMQPFSHCSYAALALDVCSSLWTDAWSSTSFLTASCPSFKCREWPQSIHVRHICPLPRVRLCRHSVPSRGFLTPISLA